MGSGTENRYFIINKPYNMVSQFISSHDVPLLGDLAYPFPEGTHAIGLLDSNSEGLLILTTDKTITRKLFLAAKPHPRSYLVLVQKKMNEDSFAKLQEGISIKIKTGKTYLAKPDAVERIDNPGTLYKYAPDPREIYPHTWLLITLSEGKFRQVRKMVLAVNHRCLRLIRLSISDLKLGDLGPGEVKEMDRGSFYRCLGLPVKI
ncbi:MAG: pseudouridine synthase [Ferruginibacter sp.]